MSQNEQNTPPEKLDIAGILAEVENSVEAKKASGEYDPEEISKVEQAAVSFQALPPDSGGSGGAADDQAASELRLHQERLSELWDAKGWGVSTHRGGAVGKAVSLLKKIIHKMSQFPVSVWLARQVSFNDELVKLFKVLLPHHTDLRRRMTHNEQRLDTVEDKGRQVDVLTQHRKFSDKRQTQGETRLDVLEENSRRHNGDVSWLKDQLVRWRELSGEFKENRRIGEARVQALERETYKGRPQMEIMLAQLEGIVQQASRELPADAAAQVSSVRWQNRGDSYLAFEDIHRGEREMIKQRQAEYLPHFNGSVTDDAPLLDIGCGRGEFLEAAREAGLNAKGLDLNSDSVEVCNQHGLDAVQADALEYLPKLEDGSLGGILMAQVIEHLTLDQLMELTSLCAAKLKDGAPLIAETVNPQCLTTFSGAFYLDLTHIKPIHPEAVRFLWRWAGLGDVEVLYLSPVPPEGRLEMMEEDELDDVKDKDMKKVVRAVNRNIDRLNQLLYGYQDYAVVGRK